MRMLMMWVVTISIFTLLFAQFGDQHFEISEREKALKELTTQIRILEIFRDLNFTVEQLEKLLDVLTQAKGRFEELTADIVNALNEYKDALLGKTSEEKLERIERKLRELEKQRMMVYKKLENDLKNILTVAQYEKLRLLGKPSEPLKPVAPLKLVPPPPLESEHMPPEETKEREHVPPEKYEIPEPHSMPMRVMYSLPLEFMLSDIFLRTLDEYLNAVRGL